MAHRGICFAPAWAPAIPPRIEVGAGRSGISLEAVPRASPSACAVSGIRDAPGQPIDRGNLRQSGNLAASAQGSEASQEREHRQLRTVQLGADAGEEKRIEIRFLRDQGVEADHVESCFPPRRRAVSVNRQWTCTGRVCVIEIVAADDVAAARGRLTDVVEWLGRHGVTSDCLPAVSNGDDAVQLQTIAEDKRAGVLVAGAYGHNRLREWVLGGVTRDILVRSRRCSLLSH